MRCVGAELSSIISTEDDEDPDTDDEGQQADNGTKAEKAPGALEHPKTDGGDTVALPEDYPKVCPVCPLNQLQHASRFCANGQIKPCPTK